MTNAKRILVLGGGFAGLWSAVGAARKLDEARRNWLGDRTDKTRTLTALYNKKSTWLADAHRRLDEAVFAAYAWDVAIADKELIARLLDLNHRRPNTENGGT